MDPKDFPVTEDPRNLFFGIRSREKLPIRRFGEQDRLFIILVGLFQLLRDIGLLKLPNDDKKMRHRKRSSKWCCRLLLCLVFLVVCYILHSNEVPSKLNSEIIAMKIKRILLGWNECDDYNNVNVTLYIRPDKKTTLIEPSDVCPTATKRVKNKLLLLAFVLSAVHHFELRKAIRETWGNYSNYKTTVNLFTELRNSYLLRDYPYVDRYGMALKENNEKYKHQKYLVNSDPVFRVVFVLGRPGDNDKESQKYIDKEAALYNDIIQEDFVDTYENLTLKTLMAVKWAINQCGDSVRYIMKSDDDAFINIPLMIEKLSDRAEDFDANTTNRNSEEYALFGLLRNVPGLSSPSRNKEDKYYVPRCYYPDDTPFPRFLAGSCGYLMSMPAARALFNASRVTPYMNMEDIYITGLAVQQCNPRIQLENDGSFQDVPINLYNAVRTCLFLNKVALGGVNLEKLWAMQRRMVDIRELEKCYLKIHRIK